MYRIIGGDQKEYGPVTADALRHWIAEGRLSAQSLVQAEGSGEWKPLSAFPEFAEALRAQAGQTASAGVASTPASGAAWSAEVLARQPEVQIGRCLALSWNLLTGNFGLLFGATFCGAGSSAIGCQFIPLIGGIINWLIYGVLYGGVYLIFLNRIRGRPASVGDVFAGFSLGFAQLMLAGFLTQLLTIIGLCCCLVLPGLYLFVAWVFSVPLVADKRLEFWSAMELSRKVVTRVWFEIFGLVLLAFLPVILTYILSRSVVSYAVFPAIQDLMHSGPPDFSHLMDVMMHSCQTQPPARALVQIRAPAQLAIRLGRADVCL